MATLGFVGLGVMGSRMVKRLLDAGHTVNGYNRTQSKAQWLIDAGMKWGDSPRAVAQTADVTLSMVTNTAALHAVADGPDGVLAGLSAGKVYVDMSTVSPAASRELAARVAAKGAAMLDAPVSGSVITLEEGKLSLMVGGEARGRADRVERLQARVHEADRLCGLSRFLTEVPGEAGGVDRCYADRRRGPFPAFALSLGVLGWPASATCADRCRSVVNGMG